MSNIITNFLFGFLDDMHIKYHLINTSDFNLSIFDKVLNNTILANKEKLSSKLPSTIDENTIYNITDYYDCNYTLFLLPSTNKYLFIGPYLYKSINNENIIFLMNTLEISKELFTQLKNYYFTLPFIADRNSFQLVLKHSYSNMCRTTNIETKYIDLKNYENEDMYRGLHEFIIQNDPILSLQLLEKQYSFENLLIKEVISGNTRKALAIIEDMLSSHQVLYENTTIQEYKNMLVSFNTLIRRSIYLLGIHPFYIDQISTAINNEINTIKTENEVSNLSIKIIKLYCKLVHTQNTPKYSEATRHILAAVEASLTSDLSLKRFANELFVNTSYLSSLFKKEIGMTLTDYVNKSRIEHAKKLLKSTSLPIQTIATQSGISDIHYFTRLFTRETGVSPRSWRNS